MFARKMSPVDTWGIPYFSAIIFAWVPFPAPGAPNMMIFIICLHMQYRKTDNIILLKHFIKRSSPRLWESPFCKLHAPAFPLAGLLFLQEAQIGRASCRERV